MTLSSVKKLGLQIKEKREEDKDCYCSIEIYDDVRDLDEYITYDVLKDIKPKDFVKAYFNREECNLVVIVKDIEKYVFFCNT